MSRFKIRVKRRLLWLRRPYNDLIEASPYSQVWLDNKLKNPMTLTIADCEFLAKFLGVDFEKIIEWIYSEEE